MLRGSEPLLTETGALRSRGHTPCRLCARMVRDGKCRLMGTLLCSSGASRHYAMVVARNGFSIEQNKGRVDDNMREGRTWGGATVFAAGSMQMRDHCGKVCGKVHFTSASNGPRSAVCGGGTAEVWGEKIPVQQRNRIA